jgi:hypothetical protein
LVKNRTGYWMQVAHAYNPSYLGGRRSGGSWFEASLGKQFTRPYLEKAYHKKGLMEWLSVDRLPNKREAEFKPQYYRKKKTE